MQQPLQNHRREQFHVLRQVEDWSETPMFLLSLSWVVLLVVELIWGLGPALQRAVTGIWIVFVLDFALKFVIAPNKLRFLRASWLTILALAIPALRVFRVARVAYVLRAGRAVRGITLARVLTAFNRGLRSLQQATGQFGFSYVLLMTALVTLLGAAGIYAFKRREAGGSLASFGDALWFTAMLITTSGSDYWPRTGEGRILCFLLALYAFAVFGYVTATLATLLIGRGAKQESATSDNDASLDALREELRSLHARLDDMVRRPSAATVRTRKDATVDRAKPK